MLQGITYYAKHRYMITFIHSVNYFILTPVKWSFIFYDLKQTFIPYREDFVQAKSIYRGFNKNLLFHVGCYSNMLLQSLEKLLL